MNAPLVLPARLGDGRVLLRHWRDEDVAQLLAGFGHPSVLACSWALTRPYTQGDARAYLAADRAAHRAGLEVGFAIVEPSDPGRLFGGGSLYDVDREQRRASIGYWLAPAARGHGYATAAVVLAAEWALSGTGGGGGLGLERLELTCAPDNHPSRAVAERAGFAYEAHLRDHITFKGRPRDSLLYARLSGASGRDAPDG